MLVLLCYQLCMFCCRYLVFEAFRDMEEMPMSHLVNAWKEIMPESDAKKVGG